MKVLCFQARNWPKGDLYSCLIPYMKETFELIPAIPCYYFSSCGFFKFRIESVKK